MPQSTVSTKYVSNRRSVARGVLSGWAFFLVEKRKETRIFVIFFWFALSGCWAQLRGTYQRRIMGQYGEMKDCAAVAAGGQV